MSRSIIHKFGGQFIDIEAEYPLPGKGSPSISSAQHKRTFQGNVEAVIFALREQADALNQAADFIESREEEVEDGK